ncbi:hypothetical protein ACH61_00802 [Rathayibacter tanaceti]|uniref:Uncharacterized protein n=1 Tax=Rathayibacter tanaceti TaxID=1671680 RepID=A0A162G005_9MICO|nr:hypothetical protein ACH61_00802 [Rathayibacter tanaceti]
MSGGVVLERGTAQPGVFDRGDPSGAVAFVAGAGTVGADDGGAVAVGVVLPGEAAVVAGAADELVAAVPGEGVLEGSVGAGVVDDHRLPGAEVAAGFGEQASVGGEAGFAAGGVVGPGEAVPLGVLLPQLAAGGVVAGGRGAAEGIGGGDGVIGGVEGAPGDAAEGVDDDGVAAAVVVLVPGDAADAVDGFDEPPGRVVPEPAGAVPGVVGPDDAAERVVAVAGGAAAGGVPGGGAASGVVLAPAGLAGGSSPADLAPVGVVLERRRGAGRIGEGREAPAPVVLEPRGGAGGGDLFGDAAGGVADQVGEAAFLVDEFHGAAAPVVDGEGRGSVVRLGRDGPAEGVEAGARGGGGVRDGGGVRVGEDGGARAGRVDQGAQRAVGVVLAAPEVPGGVGGLCQSRERVVREPPRAPVRQQRGRDVPEVVELPRDRPAERVDRAGHRAVLAVLHHGAGPERIDESGEASAAVVLVPPGRAERVAAGSEKTGRCVAVLGARSGGGHGGDHAARLVAQQTRGVPVRVGRADQIPERVVAEADAHPLRVGDLGQLAVDPGQTGASTLRVDHDTRGAVLVVRVLVARDSALLGDDRGHPVGLVVAAGDVRAGGGLRADEPAAMVVGVRGDRPVAAGRGEEVPGGVVAHRLPAPRRIDDPHEPAPGVRDPGVRAGPVRVRHDRRPAGQVGVPGGAPER